MWGNTIAKQKPCKHHSKTKTMLRNIIAINNVFFLKNKAKFSTSLI